jgi:hypothetical protein
MKSLRRTQPSPVRLRTTPVFEAYQIRAAMSALGQKQTYALQQAMSALHPIATAKADLPQMVMSALPLKADLCSAFIYVCYNTRLDAAA